MNGKAPLLLGLAALCGLAAMFGVRSLLDRPQTSEVPMSEVLVAAKEIRVEESITEEMISTKSMPTEMVPPGALTEFKQARDRWATIRMLPGDVLLDAKLAQKGTPTGMIARITPGMRAFAVRVDEQTGVSGFILPDYRVDVLQPKRDESGRADIVLENVRVLASGRVFESPEDRSIEARTVTLEVSPEQVRTLATAMQKGPLTLSLRGLNDVAITTPDPEPEPELEPEPEPPPLAVIPELPPVIAIAPEDAEPTPAPRRLTFFAGRSRPWRLEVGRNPEQRSSPPTAAEDEPLELLDARRPFQLDGLFPPISSSGIPSPAPPG